MKYYFQRPPKDHSLKVRFEEDQKHQTVTFSLFKNSDKENETDVLLDKRTFAIQDIFVENFYALLPIRDNKIMEPINMDQYRGQVGATEKIKRVYQLDDYLCYLIFGNEATLNKMSILGLYSFDCGDKRAKNENKRMNFYEILAEAVDDPTKARLDTKKRETILTLSSSESLSGLEAQVDILSKILLAFADKWQVSNPELYKELIQAVPLREYEEVFNSVAVTGVKTMEESLKEMKKQKKAVRLQQEKYFSHRNELGK